MTEKLLKIVIWKLYWKIIFLLLSASWLRMAIFFTSRHPPPLVHLIFLMEFLSCIARRISWRQFVGERLRSHFSIGTNCHILFGQRLLPSFHQVTESLYWKALKPLNVQNSEAQLIDITVNISEIFTLGSVLTKEKEF